MFVTLSFQKELELPSSQLLGLFNRTMRKVVQVKKFISEGRVLKLSKCAKIEICEAFLAL